MRFRCLLLIVLLTLLSIPLAAQNNDVGIWYSSVHTSKTTDLDGSIDFDRGSGYAVSLNHFWADWLSTEVAVTSLRQDGSLTVGDQTLLDLGRLKITAITLAGQLHFIRRSRIDPYIGGGVAMVRAGDLQSSDLDLADIGNVKIGNKTGWMANGGINLALSPSVALAVDAKYFPYKPSSSAAGGDKVELKLNPTVLSAGIRFRF
jgi:outer membrane protein W